MHVLESRKRAARINAEGPIRVLCAADGHATDARQAERLYGVRWEIVFLRGDGWSLGAPRGPLAAVAERLWAEHWTHWMRRGDRAMRPYRPGAAIGRGGR
jgi:hypothetical protein